MIHNSERGFGDYQAQNIRLYWETEGRISAISLSKNIRHKQTISQTTYGERLAGYHKNITEHYRLVQIQNMIQQTNREMELLKSRLGRLEIVVAAHKPVRQEHRDGDDVVQANEATPPLPIAELKQIAEMAKRFK